MGANTRMNITSNTDFIMVLVGGASTITLGLVAWGLKSLISTVIQNTFAIKLLTEKIGGLVDTVQKLPKLEQDIHEAHHKIRELQMKERAL